MLCVHGGDVNRHFRRVVRWWHRHITRRAGIAGKDGDEYITAWREAWLEAKTSAAWCQEVHRRRCSVVMPGRPGELEAM